MTTPVAKADYVIYGRTTETGRQIKRSHHFLKVAFKEILEN